MESIIIDAGVDNEGVPIGQSCLTQLEGLLTPLLILDENGKIQRATASFQQLLGYKAGDLQGQNIGDFVAPYERQALLKAISASQVESVEPLMLELQLLRHDGRWCDVEVQGVRVQGLPADCLAFTFHDITTHKRAEHKLQQRNLELALLNRAGQILGATLDLDKIFAAVLEEVHRLMGVAACSLWLIEPEKQ
ncbi:MAG: PAS domain-containing protein [Chloroflexota bacterium]|nr:PAS domain-containing protein [Chloroflexota bacterium]